MSNAWPMPRGAKYLLVLDDEPTVREIICEFLSSDSHQVVPAATGEEAMAALQEYGVPDLMILDYVLAGLDGIKVYRQLTAAAGRAVPTILITGMISDDLAAEASGLGVTFLNKPVKLEYLAGVVKKRLSESAVRTTDHLE
ncbi:response regulator [Rhodopila globiformis]|uniref:Response regulatory domain-containing protein n=1 Tax=Rhodopila globiformis TaxID=1071 RepID=A0A2S6NM20_RHOGL|nr:response regulator [Rhodopila globiformis]PPQ36782.1 hypothetical protein CCS01_04445 [Rhodopila globiformis]